MVAYLGGCSPGDESHWLIREAVSNFWTILMSASRSLPSGSLSASFLAASNCLCHFCSSVILFFMGRLPDVPKAGVREPSLLSVPERCMKTVFGLDRQQAMRWAGSSMGNPSRHNTVMARNRGQLRHAGQGGEQFRRALITGCVRLGFPRRIQSPETASAPRFALGSFFMRGCDWFARPLSS
jgi:hypothetical protein